MRKVTENTLAHLLDAMDTARQVTIRYVKATGEVSRRKIEIHAIYVDGKGDLIVKCYDHRSGDQHTFRLDRITHYTLHRTFGHSVPTTATPTVISSVDPMTGDEDAVTGFRAWDFTYTLAA